MKPQHFLQLHRLVYAAVLLFSGLFSSVLQAQTNLVPNTSFMNYRRLPIAHDINPTNEIGQHWITRLNVPSYSPVYFIDSVNVYNWFRANQATPDYFHARAGNPIAGINVNKGVKVPQNWGQEGDLWGAGGTTDSAYAGIGYIRYGDANAGSPLGKNDYHEYIAVKLLSHLTNGKEYLVQFKYAMAEYDNEKYKGTRNPPAQYYLRKLGVAFAPDTSFLEYDHTPSWWSQSTGLNFNTLQMGIYPTNYVDRSNLEYAYPTTWQTFERRFACTSNTLQYMIVGNFDERISLDDIRPIDTTVTALPNSTDNYQFYFFIDSVVVKEVETGACNCTSIGIKTSKRDSLLELSNPNHCCFVSTITPYPFSCKFWAVRVSKSGVPISTPAIKNFGHPVTDTEKVEVSFCVERNEYETYTTTVTLEFLDADSNVICTKTEEVNCSCECGHLQSQWNKIAVLQEPVANDSGRCCWEFSLENKSSCDFLPSTATLNVYCRDSTTYERGFYTTFGSWVRSDSLGVMKFSSGLGLPHSYSTSSYITKVFKVCVNPQSPGTTPPTLTIGLDADSNYFENSFCRAFDFPLSCVESDNCCEKLNIEFRKHNSSLADCAFDFVMSNKGTNSKCDIFGVRIIDVYGDTVYTLNPQDTALNLDSPKQIWYQNLGGCQYEPIPSNWGKTRIYTIEILDSTGAAKCSITDTFRCCPQQGLALKQAPEDDEPKATPLSVGGVINDITIESNSLHYSIKNMGDELPATIHISDLKGNVITKRKLNLTKGNSAGEFDISHLPSGTYFISVQSDLWQTSRQISIVK